MSEILQLARPELRNMVAYSSAKRENKQGDLYLNANENNLAPTAEVFLNRYPDPQPQALVKHFAQHYGVQAQQLLITRGSDEGIDLLIRTFCRAYTDAIMITPPTYGMYQISANIQGAKTISAPLLDNFQLNIPLMLEKWQSTTKLIFLCSPNNPTGNLLKREEILLLAEKLTNKAMIVVDEAYVEFARSESLISELKHYENLVVLRTLSKAYGLAAVRCGFVLAHAAIIELLNKVIAPYPIPAPVVTSVLEHLINRDQLNQQVDSIIKEREFMSEMLSSFNYVEKVWPSAANFILCKVKHSESVMKHCLDQGIVIRDRSKEYGLANCVRITVGTPRENKRLLEVLKNVT